MTKSQPRDPLPGRRRRRHVVGSTALALVLAAPATAAAQSASGSRPPANESASGRSAANDSAGAAAGTGSCPPGSWFCAEAPQQQPAPAGQPVQPLQPLPDPDETAPPPARSSAPPSPPAPSATPAPSTRRRLPPPPVVYQPPPPAVIDEPGEPPPYEYEPPPHLAHEPISRPREWGLNLHLEAATIGRGTGGDASMGGAGFGLRFKPTRHLGLEADLDFAGGHDYQGAHRSETAFMLNGLVFLNPRSRAQVYLLAGFGWSGAHVTCDPTMDSCAGPADVNYSYFGGQVGAGLEVRLTRVLAFNVDLRGFIRGRTDQLAQTQPEFTDQYGRTTNTSGGGLLTGGMTLYF